MEDRRNLNPSLVQPGLLCLVLLPFSAVGQVIHPVSLDLSNGVHVYAYDGREHKGADHYNSLCRVVLQEFGLPSDSLAPISLVFVDQELQHLLNMNNAARFKSPDWYGAFVKPSLIIMLGEEESDDTFMHEYLHFLQQQGLLFKNVHTSSLQQLIEHNEGLLLVMLRPGGPARLRELTQQTPLICNRIHFKEAPLCGR